MHQSGDDTVQKVKNTGAVTVDQRCGHADEFPADAVKLRHSVTLPAVVIVLMQLITEKAANPSAVLLLEVGTQRKAAVRALDAIRAFRMLHELPQLLQNVFVFRAVKVQGSLWPEYPAIPTDFYPRHLTPVIDRRPKRCAAMRASVVCQMLLLEEKLIRGYHVSCAVAAGLHLNELQTVRADKAAFSAAPQHGRITHIPVSGTLFTENGIYVFIPALVQIKEPIHVGDTLDHHAIGIRQRFCDLPYPLACDV